MVYKGYLTLQDWHDEVWWKGTPHMDISNGAVLWYTIGAKFTKGKYCLSIFGAWIGCVVPMAMRTQ